MSKSLLNRSIVTACLSLMVLSIGTYPQMVKAESSDSSCPARGIPPVAVKTMKMMVTAYTNIPELTDDSPNTTASNKQIVDGMVATNIFKFGTKMRIPEEYGNKVFVVEDRMNKKYNGKPHLDVYLPSYKEAKEFGAKVLKVEILES